MHEWVIEIAGPPPLLAAFQVVIERDGAQFDQVGGHITIKHPRFAQVSAPGAVLQDAGRYLSDTSQTINALTGLHGVIEPISATCHSAGHDHACLQVGIRTTVRSASEAAEASRLLATDLPLEVIRLKTSDERVAEVLSLIGSGEPSWGEIYAALESIATSVRERCLAADVKEWQGLTKLGWITSAQAVRVKRTANYFRHARGSSTLPKSPPTVHEARQVLRVVTRAWLSAIVNKH